METLMTHVQHWDGRHASMLQQALRLTIEDFAVRLEISPRTVAAWHGDGDRAPRPHAQRLLDQLLAQASTEEQARFLELRGATPDSSPTASGLHAALALVVKPGHVLLVRRRSDTALAWQFPAGVVKPEGSADDVAVNETLAETGVDCAVRRRVGSRIHPKTGVYCVYLLCDYLAGDPVNRDPVENVSVRWVPIGDLPSFIPDNMIYPPALQAIREAAS
jgi:8-oxo-dGTP diphosphatase